MNNVSDTPLDRWLRWFASRSLQWLDTLVRCAGIHNHLSNKSFSPFERQFLANGLRFVCTPPPSQLPINIDELLNDTARGLLRFNNTLMQRMLFENTAAAMPYLSKFAVKSHRGANFLNHEESEVRDQDPRAFERIDTYIKLARRELHEATKSESHQTAIRSQRPNFSKQDAEFIKRLMTDPTITIKPADKNLGMVLIDTDWYNKELNRMLGDQNTYERFDNTLPRVITQPCRPGRPPAASVAPLPPMAQLQLTLLKQLGKLAKDHLPALEVWNKHYADKVKKFLSEKVTSKNCVLPAIYLLIKVHKATGLSGRPIVPSCHWLTTPASVVVDHLLQEIVVEANITHIVKDTKSFVVELEGMVMLTRDGIFVTADIASLYTNIDTEMGLRLVREFLIERKVTGRHFDLIMDLLTFVMSHSYLTFHDLILHQIDGTAMGTACAPIYANIVVYMLERSVIKDMQSSVHLYRRFLDDVLAYLDRSVVAEFMQRMNALHPKLRFDFVVHSTEASFLDLRIHKGMRFNDCGIFDLSVHQKKMNLYLYIPFHSFHTDAAKRSFIQTELMRYIRNSSDWEDYLKIKRTFYQRLRDRGYPSSFLLPVFNELFYADRPFFLWPSKTLHLHPQLLTHPPKSVCLLRRIARWKRSLTADAVQPTAQAPPVFVVPYSPLSHVLPIRSLLTKHLEIAREAIPCLPAPIIAYQSSASLMKTLVYGRARQMELARLAALPPAPAAPTTRVQQSLDAFVQRRAVAVPCGTPAPMDCSEN